MQDVQETWVAVAGVGDLSSGSQMKLSVLWRGEANSAIGINTVYRQCRDFFKTLLYHVPILFKLLWKCEMTC